nr:SDR family oxidoreductase [Actinokineospora sp. PR83]
MFPQANQVKPNHAFRQARRRGSGCGRSRRPGRRAPTRGRRTVRWTGCPAGNPRPSRTEVTRGMGDMLDTPAAASPLGRANEPDEVARVIAYLAGEDARPITGAVLAVDAGRVATL